MNVKTGEDRFVMVADIAKLKTITDWFNENKPLCPESFYQTDSIQEVLPELGIAVFDLLVGVGLYRPEIENEE